MEKAYLGNCDRLRAHKFWAGVAASLNRPSGNRRRGLPSPKHQDAALYRPKLDNCKT